MFIKNARDLGIDDVSREQAETTHPKVQGSSTIRT
jgi:hypothetical protein